jgi:hypothetical protein
MEESSINEITWYEANPDLKDMIKTFFKSVNDHSYGNYHIINSLSKDIIISTRVRGLIDRYINGEIGVCIYIHIWKESINIKFRDHMLVFQKAIISNTEESHAASSWEVKNRVSISNPSPHYTKISMPVFPSPIVQDTKATIDIENHLLRGDIFRSIVRLYAFDNTPTLIREWANLPTGLLEIIGAITNGKFQMLLIGGRVLTTSLNGGSVNTSIQSGAEVIKYLAEFERENFGQRIIFGQNQQPACPITLHLQANRVGVIFDKISPQFGEGFAVKICPIETIPTSLKCLKWNHILKYPYGEENGKEAKDFEGVRDSRTHKRSVLAQPNKCSKADKLVFIHSALFFRHYTPARPLAEILMVPSLGERKSVEVKMLC